MDKFLIEDDPELILPLICQTVELKYCCSGFQRTRNQAVVLHVRPSSTCIALPTEVLLLTSHVPIVTLSLELKMTA